MIAVDTNLLVYAYRTDAPFHRAARGVIDGLASEVRTWAIPWPCIHEFVAVVTNPRIFKTPTPTVHALAQMGDLISLPQITMLAEGDGYFIHLETVARSAQTRGGMIHDARIAALCLHHGVSELWSADRDFSRFPALRTRNPLTPSP